MILISTAEETLNALSVSFRWISCRLEIM